MRTSFKTISIAVGLTLLSTQTFAQSAFDPSSLFPTRANYCSVVKAVASVIFTQVTHAARIAHTTFEDVVMHDAFAATSPAGLAIVNELDYVGILVYLVKWDDKIRQPPGFSNTQEQKQNALYSQMIYQSCEKDTLKLAARLATGS
jgi:hypothetical protein